MDFRSAPFIPFLSFERLFLKHLLMQQKHIPKITAHTAKMFNLLVTKVSKVSLVYQSGWSQSPTDPCGFPSEGFL